MRVLVIALLAILLTSSANAELMTDLFTDGANVVIRWAHLHHTIIANTTVRPDGTLAPYPLSPPMSARASAVFTTAMYDTWTHYDSVALPSMDYSTSKVSGSSNDIDTAISVAAWKVVQHIYKDLPNSQDVNATSDQLLFDITGLRNPSSSSKKSPVGLALTVAEELIEFRDNDGANSLGNKAFTRPNALGLKAYGDYTNYAPANRPMVVANTQTTTSCANININKWQQLTDLTPLGNVTLPFLSPHMTTVIPFALTLSSQFRPRGPPVFGVEANDRMSFEEQYTEVLNYSANLDDEMKIIAEFWAPYGPQFGNPPNMFTLFAMNALIDQNRSVKDSVKLLFALSNAAFDAGIAAWDAKRCYDNARPITGIRCLYAGQQVQAWSGFYQGVQTIDGGSWKPYQESFRTSPPFSEYISGHSSFSSAAATVLTRFFKSSKFIGPNSVTYNPGESLLEPEISNPSDPDYIAGVTDVPNSGPASVGYTPASTVVLSWETWFDAAEQAGISRLYGGIHIHDGNIDALDTGSKVGELVWEKASGLFAGTWNRENCRSSDVYVTSSGSVLSSVLFVILCACVFLL